MCVFVLNSSAKSTFHTVCNYTHKHTNRARFGVLQFVRYNNPVGLFDEESGAQSVFFVEQTPQAAAKR